MSAAATSSSPELSAEAIAVFFDTWKTGIIGLSIVMLLLIIGVVFAARSMRSAEDRSAENNYRGVNYISGSANAHDKKRPSLGFAKLASKMRNEYNTFPNRSTTSLRDEERLSLFVRSPLARRRNSDPERDRKYYHTLDVIMESSAECKPDTPTPRPNNETSPLMRAVRTISSREVSPQLSIAVAPQNSGASPAVSSARSSPRVEPSPPQLPPTTTVPGQAVPDRVIRRPEPGEPQLPPRAPPARTLCNQLPLSASADRDGSDEPLTGISSGGVAGISVFSAIANSSALSAAAKPPPVKSVLLPITTH